MSASGGVGRGRSAAERILNMDAGSMVVSQRPRGGEPTKRSSLMKSAGAGMYEVVGGPVLTVDNSRKR